MMYILEILLVATHLSTTFAAPRQLGAVVDGNRAWIDAERAHDVFAAGGDVHVELPAPGGGTREFILREMDVLPESIRTKYPELHSYVGVSVDDGPHLEAAVSFSASQGASVQVHGNGVAPLTLDPAGDGPHTVRDESPETQSERPRCGTENHEEDHKDGASRLRGLQTVDVPEALKDCPLHLIPFLGDRVCNPAANIAACDFDSGDCCSAYATCMSSTPSDCQCVDTTQNFVPHRRYRLALAATREYAEMNGGTEELVLSAMVALLTRVNAIMMRELSISFELVVGTEQLIDFRGNDLYDAFETNGARAFIDDIIGHENYDIGHVFGTFGGGIAADIGTVCSENKGGAISGAMGSRFPEVLVAHEMGHQLGADHTMASCDAKATVGNQVEAGSGFSIMSYNGLCVIDNIEPDQTIERAFFHSASHDQIFSYLRNPAKGGSCGRIIEEDTPIERPSFIADLDFDRACDGPREPVRTCKIPKLTPFRLDALTVPRDDPSLHFTWEQTGVAPFGTPQSLLHPQTANTVLYASTYSTMDKAYRVFPAMETVLKGIDRVDPTERLPSLARNIDFALFVRTAFDASATAAGGNLGASFLAEEVTVQVLDEDPLRVEQPSDPLLTDVPMQVRWTGGTQAASTVRILLSIDGGLTFPIVLAPSVSNTGSAEVTIPSAVVETSLGCGTGRARIKVESLDELEGCSFFAVNDLDVGIAGCGGALPEPEVQIPTPRPTFRPTEADPEPPGPRAPERIIVGPTSGDYQLSLSETAFGVFDLMFTTTAGQRLEMHFYSMSLNVFRGVLEVYDGHSLIEPGALLALYKGSYSGRGQTVVASGNKLRLRFTGVLPENVVMFAAQYGPEGSFTPFPVLPLPRPDRIADRTTVVEQLPPAPGAVELYNYDSSQLRYWVYDVPADKDGVRLDLEVFSVQNGYDKVDIFLDTEDSFSLCMSMSGGWQGYLLIRARRVILRFSADAAVSDTGFRIGYSDTSGPDVPYWCVAEGEPKPYLPRNVVVNPPVFERRALQTDDDGAVLVPENTRVPVVLDAGSGVLLRAAPRTRLRATFDLLSLPEGASLRLYDGSDSSAPLLRTITGPVDSVPFPALAQKRDMYVTVVGSVDLSKVKMIAESDATEYCAPSTDSPTTAPSVSPSAAPTQAPSIFNSTDAGDGDNDGDDDDTPAPPVNGTDPTTGGDVDNDDSKTDAPTTSGDGDGNGTDGNESESFFESADPAVVAGASGAAAGLLLIFALVAVVAVRSRKAHTDKLDERAAITASVVASNL